MKIEIKLSIDPGTGYPFVDGRIVNNDDVVLQVVSKTFHPETHTDILKRRFQSVSDRIIDEIAETKDRKAIIHALIN